MPDWKRAIDIVKCQNLSTATVWDYWEVRGFDNQEHRERLDGMRAEGWELISAASPTSDDPRSVSLFRRQKR